MTACSKLIAVLALCACGIAQAKVESCSQMLVETPGSVEARACFTREISALNAQMEISVKAIEREADSGRTAFKTKDLSDAQRKWRLFVESTCWLDAAGAGNSDAVFQHCVSGYVLQRLAQLKNLHAGLTGESVMWPMSNLSHTK